MFRGRTLFWRLALLSLTLDLREYRLEGKEYLCRKDFIDAMLLPSSVKNCAKGIGLLHCVSQVF